MPETRYIKEFKDGQLVNSIPYVVSDEELTQEQEAAAMRKAETMIDNISSLAEAKVFLKKLCQRLFKNGALP